MSKQVVVTNTPCIGRLPEPAAGDSCGLRFRLHRFLGRTHWLARKREAGALLSQERMAKRRGRLRLIQVLPSICFEAAIRQRYQNCKKQLFHDYLVLFLGYVVFETWLSL
jgi:hypothetical protein